MRMTKGGRAQTRTVEAIHYNFEAGVFSVDFLEDPEVSFEQQGIGFKSGAFYVYWTPTQYQTWKRIG